MEGPVQQVCDFERTLLNGVAKMTIRNELIDEMAHVGRAIIPQLAAGGCKERTENAGVGDSLPALKDGGSADGPAGQALGVVEKIVHFLLREIVYLARQISEVKCLNWLDAECDLVDDAAEAIARSNQTQQLRVAGFRGFSEVTRRRYPLDPCDVRTDLTEFYPVKSVFAVAAG